VVISARLHAAGIPLASIFITGDDVRHGKPDPEGYLQAASLLHVVPEACVVSEDAVAGIEAARVVQMRVIAVATTHHPNNLGNTYV
jgi:sugar-phosphatase